MTAFMLVVDLGDIIFQGNFALFLTKFVIAKLSYYINPNIRLKRLKKSKISLLLKKR